MGTEITTLYHNPWISLKELRSPERGAAGYVFSHETRCQGRIVALLPFRYAGGEFEFLIRREVTPCWGMEPTLSAITGGYEGGDIVDDAIRELAEESGYTITRKDLVWLGESYASKSSDTVYSLFTVNLSGFEQGEATGDGSGLEDAGDAVWLTDADLSEIRDPQVPLMYMRLMHHLLGIRRVPQPSPAGHAPIGATK